MKSMREQREERIKLLKMSKTMNKIINIFTGNHQAQVVI